MAARARAAPGGARAEVASPLLSVRRASAESEYTSSGELRAAQNTAWKMAQISAILCAPGVAQTRGGSDSERYRAAQLSGGAAVRSRDEQIAAMTRLGLINQVAAQI